MSLLSPRHGDAGMDMPMAGAPTVSAASEAHGSDSMGSMGSMMMGMVFNTDMQTALYTNSWTPRNPGAYAATCIFLIALAVVGRLLLAAKSVQEGRWLDRDANRRYIASNARTPFGEQFSRNPDAKDMTLSENGIEESIVVVGRKGAIARPWRFSVDPVRAVMDTAIAAVGYMLMLAVMTMNVGYFLSVLAGVFVGSMAVGRFSAASAGH